MHVFFFVEQDMSKMHYIRIYF